MYTPIHPYVNTIVAVYGSLYLTVSYHLSFRGSSGSLQGFGLYSLFWKSPEIFIRVRLEGARSAEPPIKPGRTGARTLIMVWLCWRVASGLSSGLNEGRAESQLAGSCANHVHHGTQVSSKLSSRGSDGEDVDGQGIRRI